MRFSTSRPSTWPRGKPFRCRAIGSCTALPSRSTDPALRRPWDSIGRAVRVPVAWRGQRVMLRFDGVLYGFAVWVKWPAIGEWGSSFNRLPSTSPDALLVGDAENVIAVRVTTRSKAGNFRHERLAGALRHLPRGDAVPRAGPPISRTTRRKRCSRPTVRGIGSEVVASAAAEGRGANSFA